LCSGSSQPQPSASAPHTFNKTSLNGSARHFHEMVAGNVIALRDLLDRGGMLSLHCEVNQKTDGVVRVSSEVHGEK
jgi:hypothetical protein